ncbi:hypothetical protein QQ045_020292 [Rhodiola kirilowii]
MDFVNKAISSVTPAKTEEPKVEPKSTEPSAAAGMLTSAKDTAGVGIGKVAGATGDLLHAGKEYGKLDETKGVGKAVVQAETFVRGYETPAVEEKKVATEGEGVGGYVKAAGDFFKTK